MDSQERMKLRQEMDARSLEDALEGIAAGASEPMEVQ